MKFWDRVKVDVISGYGWNGCASGRKEKYIAFWWPDGGDGWKWWSIYFVGDEWLSSLIDLHYKKQIKAKHWEHWKGSDQYGEDAQDVFVKVPLWTTVKDKNTGRLLWTIMKHWEKLLIAKWWRWWWGNIHFKNAIKQFPDFAMYGEPGEKKILEVELQLVWDVTLIGYPSVWKSSIINTLSNAKAKVAEYSFTTLVPNLWVVKHKNRDFVLVDVPWLIEWAWNGKWLGNEFLRHILKSKVWTFVVDISRFEDSLKELEILKNEIEKFTNLKLKEEFPDIIFQDIDIKYETTNQWIKMDIFHGDKLLFSKTIVFLINKIDLVQDEEILEEFKKELETKITNLFWIKAGSIFIWHSWNREIFNNFLDEIIEILKNKNEQNTVFDEYLLPKPEYLEEVKEDRYVKNITEQEIPKLLEEDYIDENQVSLLNVFEVANKKLAYYSYILPWGNREAVMLFFDVMKSEWISKWLEQNGVMVWDILKIKSPYAWIEDRYITWEL
jgi:GTP-binding protein